MTYFTIIKSLVILWLCSQTLAHLEELQRLESFHYCTYDSDCYENSFCYGNDGVNAGKCRCKNNHVLIDRNRTYYECLLVAEGLDSPCSKDVQCQVNLGKEAICSETDNICQCGEAAYYGDGRCYKRVALGEICESNFNCRLGDSSYGFCVAGRCSCNILHHPSEDGQRCIPTVPLGKSCATTESCIHTFAKCYGGICKCLAGYIESDNNRVCLQAANKVGDSCTEFVQCSAYITGSFCSNDTCSCKSAHHGYGNECVLDAKLGDRCNHDKQCILNAELQNSVRCTGGVCTCVEGVSDENSYGCVLVSSSIAKKFKPITYVIALCLVAFNIQYLL